MYSPLPYDDWLQIIDEVIEQSKINKVFISSSRLYEAISNYNKFSFISSMFFDL